MKRIVSLILLLIFSVQAAYAADASTENALYNTEELSKAVFILNELGIMSLQEESEIWQDTAVSRAELAEMICKAFKLETSSANVYFIDVPPDMWAYGAITALAEAGIVSIPEDRVFRVNDTVTYAEALKMVLGAAKYGIYAENIGGFPYGYIKAAQRLELDVSGSEDAGLTVASAVTLIYNVMTMGYYEPEYYTDSEAVPYREADKTIFAVLWNTHIERGILTAYYGASYQNAVYEKDEVIIDNVKYRLSDEMYLDDCFLNEIEFIYKKINDDERSIVYVEDTRSSDDIVVESDSITGFNSGAYTLEFYKNDKNQSRAVERGAVVIYNGAVYNGSITEVIEEFTSGDKRGSVRFKDYNNDGGFDMLIIKSYRSFVVGYADVYSNRIYNKLDSADCIDMSAYTQVVTRSTENKSASLELSNLPLLLSVAEAKDKSAVEMIICKEKLTGKTEQISGTGKEAVFSINGKKYNIDYALYKKYLTDENGNVISASAILGAEYDFYIDRFGYIAYMSELGAGDGFKLGYIIDGVHKDTAFSGELMIKMLDEAGTISTFNVKDKVVIDGNSYKLDDYKQVISAIENGARADASYVQGTDTLRMSQQLVRYIADENNTITEIDTAYTGENENTKNTLTLLPEVNNISYRMYHVTGGIPKFGSNILFNTTNTKVFSKPLVNTDGELIVLSDASSTATGNVLVPGSGLTVTRTRVTDVDGSPATPDDYMYVRGIPEGSFSSDSYYYVKAYKYNPNTAYADALVYSYSVYRSILENIMFDEWSEAVNESGETVNVFNGWERGVRVSYEIADGSDISDLERGDIVYCWRDAAKKKIAFVKKIYDVGEDIFLNRPYTESATRFYPDYMWMRGYWVMDTATGQITTYNYRTMNALTKGKVLDKTDTVMSWDWDGDYRTVEEAFDFSNIPIVIYDKNAPKEKIYVGSVADVPDYESVKDNAARIVLNKDRERGVCAFIYLNE